jgi:hypothetical protein
MTKKFTPTRKQLGALLTELEEAEFADVSCWRYRSGENGEVEKRLFESLGDLPTVGIPWRAPTALR